MKKGKNGKKEHSKKGDLNPTISISILHKNGLMTPIKSQIVRVDKNSKTQLVTFSKESIYKDTDWIEKDKPRKH